MVRSKNKHLCVLQQHDTHTAPLTQSSPFQSALSSTALIAIVSGLQTRHFVTPAVSAALSGTADAVALPTCHYNIGQEAQSQWKQQRNTQQQGLKSNAHVCRLQIYPHLGKKQCRHEHNQPRLRCKSVIEFLGRPCLSAL